MSRIQFSINFALFSRISSVATEFAFGTFARVERTSTLEIICGALESCGQREQCISVFTSRRDRAKSVGRSDCAHDHVYAHCAAANGNR